MAACTGEAVEETSTTDGGGSAVNLASPPPPAPIAPVLRQAGPPGEALVGVESTLGALVLAENPISRLELWDGSVLINEVDLEQPESDVRTAFEWVPDREGLHGLTLRAMDTEDGVATSFPLWIRVRQPLELEAGIPPPAVPTSDLLLDVSFTTEASAVVPVFGRSFNAVEFENPGLIQFSIDATTCIATLELPAAQDALGMAVYAAPMGSVGYFPLDLVGPQGGNVEVPIGAAPMMVYAESYDSTTTNPGSPLVIAPPNPCVAKGWSGDFQFNDGILTNTWGASQAYLYSSSDGGEVWERVPGEDQTFVYPNEQGNFDFSGLLTPASNSSGVVFEAWGWVDDTLTPLGRGGWKPSEGSDDGSGPGFPAAGFYTGAILESGLDWVISGPSLALVREGTICTYTPVSSDPGVITPALDQGCSHQLLGNYSKTFRWTPLAGAYESGLVQVSTMPIPTGPVTNFPGLTHVQSVAKPGSGFIDFDIPIDQILNPPADTTAQLDYGTLTYADLSDLASKGRQGGNASTTLLLPPKVKGGGTTNLYIRVIPSKEGKLLAGESNDVVIHIDDTPPPGKLKVPPPQPSIFVETTMSPPMTPNPNYKHCVRVVENPFFFGANPAPDGSSLTLSYKAIQDAAFIFENGAKVNKGMVEGSTVCAYKPNPPSKAWYEYIVDAVSFAGWVWDTFVTVWEKLKGFVADVIAVASGCVATAQLTGASLEKAKEFCSGLAQTAITVALAAYGVPPTMPKFADFADVAKGELKEFLIKTAFDQTGVDCNLAQAECEEMLDKLLDKMLDEIQLAASKAAVEGASSGGWVMWINPAIKVIPEPAGGRLTATFTMKVTRNPHPNAPPPPASCTTSAHVWGSKAHYEWKDYKKNEWQTGPVIGQVMISKTETFDFSDLEPGESTKVIIVLDTINTWFPPGGNPNPGWLPVSGYDTKTGIFFSDQGPGPGGTTPTKLTMSLGGCLGGESVDFNQDHLLTEPWEILPYP